MIFSFVRTFFALQFQKNHLYLSKIMKGIFFKMNKRQNIISSIEAQKERMRREREVRQKQGDAVSGVVVASKIANSISKGYIDSVFDTPTNPDEYQKLMQELTDSVQRAEKIRDNVTILTVPPTQKLIPGKLTVINLPGNGTSLTDNDRNPLSQMRVKVAAEKGVAQFFDFLKDDIDVKPADCQTVGCYYSHKVNELIEQHNACGILHEGIVEFSSIFDDLISKNGQKIDAKEAVANMQNVILRGQCFGTLVAAELEKCLYMKLAKLGYTDKECQQILSAPTAVFSSSPVAMDRQPQFFKTVAYANAADTLIPTIAGSPQYKDVVGFSKEDVASENRQIRMIQKAKNYKLLVCSSLEFPDMQKLRDYVAKTYHLSDEARIQAHITTILKGHAFNAVTNAIDEDSVFMKTLCSEVKKMMAEPVRQVVENYRLGTLDFRPKIFDSPLYIQAKKAKKQDRTFVY